MLAQADAAQESLPRAGSDCFVERKIEEGSRAQIRSRHLRLAPRPDEADRTRHLPTRDRHDRRLRLVTGHPSDLDSADRRPDRDRSTLVQGKRAEADGGDGDESRENRRRNDGRPALATRTPGGRDKEIGHAADGSRGFVKIG